ncbi:hypothetical protein BG004_005811 [Podila humilis]|nr:hypothetical protein BG004_005811 [Podila humilis]
MSQKPCLSGNYGSYGAGSTTDGKALYVYGGRSSDLRSESLITFTIDLSVPWPLSQPVCTYLSTGVLQTYLPNGLLNDGVTWATVANNTLYTFDTKTAVSIRRAALPSNISYEGIGAIVHPVTDEFIILSLPGSNEPKRATIYSSSDFTAAALVQPPEFSTFQSYSMAWSPSHKATFVFGGVAMPTASFLDTLWRVDIQNGEWTRISSSGGPSARQNACMVAAQGGDKLVVFGGRLQNSVGSDVYVYDIASKIWTRGRDGGETRARHSHVCGMTGNKLIVWGGLSGTNLPVNETTSVYDVRAVNWQDQFSPSVPWASTYSGPVDGPESSGSKSNVGAIAGGVGGAITLVGFLAGFINRRRRQQRQQQQKSLDNQKMTTELQPEQYVDMVLEGKLEYPGKSLPVNHGPPEFNSMGIVATPEQHNRNPQQAHELLRAAQTSGNSSLRNPQHYARDHEFNASRSIQGSQRQQTLDRLRQMQFAERQALDELIEQQSRQLQMLREQRQEYQASFDENHRPLEMDDTRPANVVNEGNHPGTRNPQLR